MQDRTRHDERQRDVQSCVLVIPSAASVSLLRSICARGRTCVHEGRDTHVCDSVRARLHTLSPPPPPPPHPTRAAASVPRALLIAQSFPQYVARGGDGKAEEEEDEEQRVLRGVKTHSQRTRTVVGTQWICQWICHSGYASGYATVKAFECAVTRPEENAIFCTSLPAK